MTMITIDCCGLRCPMPLLKAKLQYSTLPIGESFCLVADDPAAGPDIERWATRVGAGFRILAQDPLKVEISKAQGDAT